MPKTQTHHTTIGREIVVEFIIIPPSRGARDSLGGKAGAGPALEPDEPMSIEIEKVLDTDGNVVELTDNEEARIVEEILEDLNEGDYYGGDID